MKFAFLMCASGVCLSLSSCSSLSWWSDDEAQPVVEAPKTIVEKQIVYVTVPAGADGHLPGTEEGLSGDGGMHSRPGLRDPDLGATLPLNLDGSINEESVKASVNAEAPKLGPVE